MREAVRRLRGEPRQSHLHKGTRRAALAMPGAQAQVGCRCAGHRAQHPWSPSRAAGGPRRRPRVSFARPIASRPGRRTAFRRTGRRTITRAPRRGCCAACTSRSETARPSSCAGARGRILDVVVDLRAGSPAYGRWEAVELSDENNASAVRPDRPRTRFVVLCEVADVTYKCTTVYDPRRARYRLRRSSDRHRVAHRPGAARLRRDATAPTLAEVAGDLPFRYSA